AGCVLIFLPAISKSSLCVQCGAARICGPRQDWKMFAPDPDRHVRQVQAALWRDGRFHPTLLPASSRTRTAVAHAKVSRGAMRYLGEIACGMGGERARVRVLERATGHGHGRWTVI